MTLTAILFLSWMCAGCLSAAEQPCAAQSTATEANLVEYVRAKYRLDASTELRLAANEPLQPCYRKLTFEGKNSLKTWQLTLYLSPDGRYLTTDLLDTTKDPIEEQRQHDRALMAGLVPNTGASRGSSKAPVTIVVFSDFECPFCKKFADITNQVLPGEQDKVRLVFHHFPLPMHEWARTAAEGAACAQLQSSKAFWSMHDQLFHNQQDLTSGNIKQRLQDFAKSSNDVDVAKFEECMQNQMSLGLIFQDSNLATANNIQATPTLFINGRKVAGVRDANQLKELIRDASNEAKSAQSDISKAIGTGGGIR